MSHVQAAPRPDRSGAYLPVALPYLSGWSSVCWIVNDDLATVALQVSTIYALFRESGFRPLFHRIASQIQLLFGIELFP